MQMSQISFVPFSLVVVPAGQGKQLSDARSLIFPTSQGRHPDCPAPPWNVPASQSLQLIEPAFAAYLPVPHASQLSLPLKLWYRPFSQSLHSAAPAWLFLPAAQSTHNVVLVTFEMPEVLPAGHVSQLSDPSAKVVRPASHAVQSPAPA